MVKNKEKKGNILKKIRIYEWFKQALNYVSESKNYILFSIVLFLISISLGMIFTKLFEEQLLRLIKQLLEQTRGLNLFEMISFIMFNNIKSSFFGMFFGMFFGIVPIALIIVNGFLLGFVINRVVISDGFLILWKLFPHGIFEIPAILISVGIGLRLGLFFLNIKNKTLGILAFIFSAGIFLFLLSFFSWILSIFIGIENFNSSYAELMKNLGFVLFYFILLLLFFYLGVYFSLFIFNKKEREILKKEFLYNLKMSFFVFIFVVIPLLVIAGIIEGSLISLIGG